MILTMRQERINKGWSQQYVADTVGISREAIQQLETGTISPSYKVLVKLEDLFEKNHRDLFAPAHDDPDLSRK